MIKPINKKVLLILNAVCLILIGIHAGIYYALLPDLVSSGSTNSTMPKLFLTLLYAVVSVFIAAMFVGTGYFIPRLPVECINLPNAEFWFNQENRQESFDFMAKWMYTYSLLILLMLFIVFQIIFSANFQNPFQLTWVIWIPIVLFMVLTGVMVFWLVFRFKYLTGTHYNRVSDNL